MRLAARSWSTCKAEAGNHQLQRNKGSPDGLPFFLYCTGSSNTGAGSRSMSYRLTMGKSAQA